MVAKLTVAASTLISGTIDHRQRDRFRSFVQPKATNRQRIEEWTEHQIVNAPLRRSPWWSVTNHAISSSRAAWRAGVPARLV